MTTQQQREVTALEEQLKELVQGSEVLRELDSSTLLRYLEIVNKTQQKLEKNEPPSIQMEQLLEDSDYITELSSIEKSGKATAKHTIESNHGIPQHEWSNEEKHLLFDKEIYDDLINSIGRKQEKIVNDSFDLSDDSGYRDLSSVSSKLFKCLEQLRKNYPNTSAVLDYIETSASLSLYSQYGEFQFPPILIAGPPGVGKTAVIRTLGKLAGIPFHQFDCGTFTSQFVISGSSRTWHSSQPGIIANAMKDCKYANPFILFDEIDKISANKEHDPYGSFYTLLDNEAAKNFKDEFISELTLDLSKVNFIATANDLSAIPEPIVSRFHVIHVESLTEEQSKSVIVSIYNNLLQGIHHKNRFEPILKAQVIGELKGYAPRDIKKVLLGALSNCADRNRKSKLPEKINTIQPSDIVHLAQEEERSMGFVWS